VVNSPANNWFNTTARRRVARINRTLSSWPSMATEQTIAAHV
jgi:hypothetical protein